MTSTPRARHVLTVLFVAIALAALAGGLASSAHAGGVDPERLAAQGWNCFVPPPFPDRIACFNPGVGRPFPGNPDPRPAYTALVFDRSSGDLLHAAHLIRQDLYQGQPCVGGEPYRFIPLIGYYECVRG